MGIKLKNDPRKEFQFLIGRLATIEALWQGMKSAIKFQFLIGRLATKQYI